MNKLTKDQLVFVVDLAMVSGLDRIESAIPDTISLEEYREKDVEIGVWIRACIETVGMNLACLWAQTIGKEVGDGKGIGDALAESGFRDLCETFVAERTDPTWSGLKDGDRCFPSTKELAAKFVDDEWGDYFSPYSDRGFELDDGGVIEFPDPYSGDIRHQDANGSTVDIRHYGDANARYVWGEWYSLFDDADPSWRFFCGLKVRVRNEWDGEIIDVNLNLEECRVKKVGGSEFCSWHVLVPLTGVDHV